MRTAQLRLMARVVYAVLLVGGATLGLTQPSVALTEDLTIAAASDLNFAFKDLVVEYEKKTGVHVKLSLGSSGNFFSQISNGAPFDLYSLGEDGKEGGEGPAADIWFRKQQR